ncbi:hypothetical protein V6N11_020118 [Hibiscus sabdariffa]|uniref:Uncharacterized protein n=1 Tax=Hibiscus sabdariffa TaxID=183260 RepID=A0ABR2P8P2_9ROSI
MSLNPSLPLPSLQNVGPGDRPPDTMPAEMDHEGVLADTSVQQESRPTHKALGDPDVRVIAGLSHDRISSSLEEEMHQVETTTHESTVVTDPRAFDANRGRYPTYASMVVNNPSMVGKKVSDWRTDNDNVVVLEADYIIDRSGQFPSIKYLGSRGKVLSGGSGSRYDVLAREVEPMQETLAVNGSVLDMSVVLVADSNEVPAVGRKARMESGGKTRAKIVAYVESIPDVRSKKLVPSTSNVRVVAVGKGKVAEVHKQVKSLGNAHHTPTTIVEKSLYSGVATGDKISKARELEAASMIPGGDLKATVEDTGQGAMHGGNGIVEHGVDVLEVSD